MTYNIISSGSKGNAVIIEDTILIDCGVAYKAVKPYISGLKLVLLTHIHGDHFNRATIHRLAFERPTLRFGCGEWLINDLLDCGVSPCLIDIYAMDTVNQYSTFSIEAFKLYHNVSNCGYKVAINGQQLLYATDTSKIDTAAPDFDLYMVEANYDDDEIEKRIEDKIINGVDYIYEYRARENHLSQRDAYEFIVSNAGPKSEYILMHMHEGEPA
jgi:phosphoribosyl 1,2-cyclic phosphodiesterase